MVKVINIDTKTRTIRVENAADGDIKTWRTTESGTHFPIKKGESTKEALDKFVEKKRPEAKKDKKKYIEFEEQGQTYRFPKPTKHEKLWDQAWKNVEESRRYSDPAPGGNATAEHTPEETEEEVRAEYKKLKTAERAKQAKEKLAKKESDWPESPKFEKLTEQYMPKQGEADNELGEVLRSINQVVYRYYNDGDMWNKGYGKETVNGAIKHLTALSKNKETPRHIARGLDNALFELKKYGVKDKDRYETALKIMMQTMEWADENDIEALSKMKRNTEKQQPAKKESGSDAGLDRELARGGLSDDEISILRNRLQDYYDISDQTLLSAIKSGEYSVKEIYKRLRNYDDDFADHLVDLEDGTVHESKQQFVWSETESSKGKQKDDGEEYEPWEKEKREKKEPTRAGDIVKIKYSDGSFGVGKVNCFTTHDNEIGCEVEDDQGRLRFYPKKQLEALKYVPKSEITDGWTNDSYYNGIKGIDMRAELYKDPAVKEAASKRVERSQRVEAETGVSPEDWEAYESVRESGASNMYDYAYINATTGLPRETIRKIQENYEKLQEAYGQD